MVRGVLHRDVSIQRGFNGNVLRGYPTSGCVQRGFKGNFFQMGSKINVLGGDEPRKVIE